MINVHNLVKRFGSNTAVDHVTFTVRKGEVLGFLGPNGAGKSTTMRVITGYLRQDEGTVFVGNYDIRQKPIEAKALIGYLPESAPLYQEMKVCAFLKFAAAIRGLSAAARSRAIERVVEQCCLAPVYKQSIGTLSKGYRHRTCFAQALIHDPDVLILDEPTDGLDPNQKHEMRQLIREMGKDKAIIISTHILEEVNAACSRVAIIDNGKMVFDGKPDVLLQKSAAHGTVRIKLRDVDQKLAVEQLYTIANISKIDVFKAGVDEVAMLVYPKPGITGLSGEISSLCHSSGWHVAELKEETGRLDEVFRELTMGRAKP